APAERPGRAPGGRRAAERERTARSRRSAGELRRRAAGELCAGRAELQRSAADLLRQRAGVLRAGAGVLLGLHGALLRRAGGDRSRHRLLDRQHLAPRLPPRLARPPRLALKRCERRIEKGPAGPFFFLLALRAAGTRQASALATTRAISRILFE